MVSHWASGLGARCARAVFAGAMGGAAAGAIDAIWSWGPMSQFVSGGGKLRALAYLAVTYGLGAALMTPVFVFLGTLLWRGTRMHRAGGAIAETSDTGASRLALVIGMTLALLGSLVITFEALAPTLAARKHLGLVVAVAMGAGVLALVVGVVLGFVLSQLLELGLGRLGQRVQGLIGSRRALVLVGIAIAAGLIGLVVWRAWETVGLLRLRPLIVALLGVALVFGATPLGDRVATGLASLRPSARRGSLAGIYALLAAAALWFGSSSPALKAATHYSGLGGPFTQGLRTMFDFDRDGYSRFLGGGDCNDWNGDVHPGAPDLPDDGVDGNCVGGDIVLATDQDKVSFFAPPAALPADFNVVLITIDTLRADHLGAYGYKRATSPALDALAADGTLFENGWAHAPSTRYSIPAILTGRMPLAVDYIPLRNAWPGLADANWTIAEMLKSRGFTTGAILNYWYFEERRRMNQGFDHYDNSNRRLHKAVPGKGPAQTRGSSSKEQTDKAIEYLERVGDSRFFLWVHYYDPHYAYEAHPGTTSFGDGRVALYDQEIRYTDDHIGRLISDLKRRGLYDKTVFVVTGDHGEGFGEHGIDLHGYHLYAAQTKVPFIVRVPGATPRRVQTAAAHVDILPTLANLAGADPVGRLDGESLVGLIDGSADDDGKRTIFQQLSYENNNEMRAAANADCHVIFNVSPHRSWEAYDLRNDPNETRDIAGSSRCAETRAALERFYDRSEVPPDAASALLPNRPSIATPLDVDFLGTARLLEVTLPSSPVRRGEAVPLRFTFAPEAGLDGDWKVFVHFVGRGKAFMQADHKPARPFAWWRDGQFIQYERPLFVPSGTPAGEYRVYVGLFKGKERHPVKVRGAEPADRRALVGSLKVAP